MLGWNVVDFDLRVLLAPLRGAAPAAASSGRVRGRRAVPAGPRIHAQARAEVPGRIVLDGLALVRDALRLDDYRLDTVARDAARPRQADRRRGARRRRARSRACTARIPRRSSPTTARTRASCSRSSRTRGCSRSPSSAACSRACSSTASARASRRSTCSTCRSCAARLRGAERGRASASRSCVRAARCSSPCPGCSRDVAVFDFKSLYPSLIRTFSLDPLAHARAGDDADRRARTARASRARARSCRA